MTDESNNVVCGFSVSWVGPCKKPAATGGRCDKHAGLKCSSCDKPATHDCDETMGPCVCGSPLCDDCEHEIAEDGTNGFKVKHCRRGQQKYEPWYLRARPATTP